MRITIGNGVLEYTVANGWRVSVNGGSSWQALGGAGSGAAEDITFDPTGTALLATDVQTALAELYRLTVDAADRNTILALRVAAIQEWGPTLTKYGWIDTFTNVTGVSTMQNAYVDAWEGDGVTEGPQVVGMNSNYAMASRFTTTESWDIDALAVEILDVGSGGLQNLKVSIQTHNGGSNIPSNTLVDPNAYWSEAIQSTDEGWTSYPTVDTFTLPAGTYWLVAQPSTPPGDNNKWVYLNASDRSGHTGKLVQDEGGYLYWSYPIGTEISSLCYRINNANGEPGQSTGEIYEPENDRFIQALVGAPASYWAMDEASGDSLADRGTSGNTATASGTTVTTGKYGSGRALDGSSYIEAPNHAAYNGSLISFGGWFKPTDDTGYYTILLIKPDYNSGGGSEQLSLGKGGGPGATLWCVMKINGTMRAVEGPLYSTLVGGWHHVVCTYDGVDLKMYIDGTLANTANWPGTVSANSEPLGIGGHSNANFNRFVGAIDEVFVAATALSASEVADIYARDLYVTADLSLISMPFTAEAEPATARALFVITPVDAVTLNTDLKAWASRDDGTTWTQITLALVGDFDADSVIVAGSADISAQPSGTTMRYKLTSHNAKALAVEDGSLFWAE